MTKISVLEFVESINSVLSEMVTTYREEQHTTEEWTKLFTKLTEEDSVSNDPVETSRATSIDDIDHTAVSFGKYKGKTPSQIAVENEGYITWAYEKLDKRFCSYLLYKDCGGRGPARWQVDREAINNLNPAKWSGKSVGFDDFDDDIPF